MTLLFARLGIATLIVLLLTAAVRPAAAAREGTLTWGVHVTLAARWLDPGDTDMSSSSARASSSTTASR